MEQFNLEKWLQDKSRKIVTRDGRPVRIICWDRYSGDDDRCIVGLVDNGVREDTMYFDKLGHYSTYSEGFCDLFFADELTEFEKELVDLVSGWCDSHIETPEEYINKRSQTLLDLARKELEKENTWSEEDETKLITVQTFIRNTSLIGVDGIKEATIDWLKSLKDRV